MKLSRASRAESGRLWGSGDGGGGEEGRILYMYFGTGVGGDMTSACGCIAGGRG